MYVLSLLGGFIKSVLPENEKPIGVKVLSSGYNHVMKNNQLIMLNRKKLILFSIVKLQRQSKQAHVLSLKQFALYAALLNYR